MSISVNNAVLKEVPQTEQVEAKNISYRANPNNTLERTPNDDYYDNSKKKKTIGIIAGALITAVAILAGICWHKGKPAEGEKSKEFFERIKDGWKELWGKGKKAAGDAKNGAEDAANGTKTEGENAAREATAAANETGNAAGKATETAKSETEKTSEIIKNEETEIRAEAKRRIEKEKALAEARKLNREQTKAAELPSKSAEESFEFFDLALNGRHKLNYELQVGTDKVVVENGLIKKCINAKGEEWHISEKTNKEYAQKIYDEVSKKSEEIMQKNADILIAKAERQNIKMTKAMDRVSKSAKDSAAVFKLGAEAEELQKYCKDTYGEILENAAKMMHEDIHSIPKAKVKKLEDGRFEARVGKGKKEVVYYTDENDCRITEILHEHPTDKSDNVVVRCDGNRIIANTENERVNLASDYAKDSNGFAEGCKKGNYYGIKMKSPRVYEYHPYTEKAHSQIRMSDSYGYSDTDTKLSVSKLKVSMSKLRELRKAGAKWEDVCESTYIIKGNGAYKTEREYYFPKD